MPSDLENAKLLFLCLQFSTATTFDYKTIGEECGISAGAASKRMSRLKQAVKEGKETGLDMPYLWSCIQHSDLNNIDFKAVGAQINLTSGAASKRWSRLKQALQRSDTGSMGGAAVDGAQAGGNSSGKKAAAGTRKRQMNSDSDDREEDSGTAVFKEARSSSCVSSGKVRLSRAHSIATKDVDNNGADDATEANENAVAGKSSITPNPKPVAPRVTKAVTTGRPKKQQRKQQSAAIDAILGPAVAAAGAAGATATNLTNSAPPVFRSRRGRRLTDEELYRKHDVEAAEEREWSQLSSSSLSTHAYPRHHNLTATFQALRPPAGATCQQNENDQQRQQQQAQNREAAMAMETDGGNSGAAPLSTLQVASPMPENGGGGGGDGGRRRAASDDAGGGNRFDPPQNLHDSFMVPDGGGRADYVPFSSWVEDRDAGADDAKDGMGEDGEAEEEYV